ncbi:biotin synthase BioB [Phycisphaerales bacterium AB-hyl4]|uniref:Biotin synthase n=1 Tax=Natronomicrosphaera hydrolytica TaxID=3242702 RepID=A0ABV4U792_9BACT
MDMYKQWADLGQADEAISQADALAILHGERDGEPIELLPLLEAAGAVRRRYFGNTVTAHILDNVQNGACPEDCNYCGQSKISDSPIKPYKIKPVDEIVAEAKQAKEAGAWRFCMALSGRGPDDRDIEHMGEAIRRISDMGLRTCLSAGLMDDAKAKSLKSAGLDRLNHNLNTSEKHYPSICTTHTYEDRMNTLRAAREAGLGTCSGLIAGMGEGYEDLVSVAFELRKLGSESIPVNFLLPIEGNPLLDSACEGQALNPQLVLRILCMVRLVNPTAEVRVGAGREHHLRSMQSFALWPANSLFVDGYLLTEGSEAAATFQMIRDAGYELAVEGGQAPQAMDAAAAATAGAAATKAQGCCGSGHGNGGGGAGSSRPTVNDGLPRLKSTVTDGKRFVPAGEVRLPQR